MMKKVAQWTKAKMPGREDMTRNRWLAPIAHRFGGAELWRFTRRSVPRGVALGLFAGFIIPFGQIFLAAFLALPAKANVPLAAAVTFITNPFTVPFWLVVANKVGRLVLKIDAVTFGAANESLQEGGFWEKTGWFIETAGVTAFGFVVLSVVSAAIGYLVASFAWRFMVAHKWKARPGHTKMLHPAE